MDAHGTAEKAWDIKYLHVDFKSSPTISRGFFNDQEKTLWDRR